MKTNLQIPAFFLGAALACGPAFAIVQQSATSPDTSQDSGAKQDMKNAGHDTKNAAKDAAHGTKQGTEKAYNSTKHGVKKAGRKTKNTTKGAVNGTKQGAQQPQ